MGTPGVSQTSGLEEALLPPPPPPFIPSSLALSFEVGGGTGFSSAWLSSGEGLLKCKNTHTGHISSSCLLKVIATNRRQRFEALMVAVPVAAGLTMTRQSQQQVQLNLLRTWNSSQERNTHLMKREIRGGAKVCLCWFTMWVQWKGGVASWAFTGM